MSLGKRHIGRRVAGVGVGVALMVLGLAAPAFAAPAVTAFTPTSGPAELRRGRHGNGLRAFPGPNDRQVRGTRQATVDVDAATGSTIISDTEIWATVPRARSAGTGVHHPGRRPPGNRHREHGNVPVDGDGRQAACAPTITSFTPTCGAAGTVVTITGTNLLAPDSAAARCEFSPYAAGQLTTASHHRSGLSLTPTSLSVIVPSGVADGPIPVTTLHRRGPSAGVQHHAFRRRRRTACR